MTPFKPLVVRSVSHLATLIQRHPGAVAAFGFASGMASFLLVERNESLAQVIGLLMLVSWLWLMLESWLRAGILKRFGFAMPPAVMRFATQLVHQESLFFTLPFFLATTTWDHGQAGFTLLLLGCALVSLIDPLYYNWLAPRRSLFVAYHALTLFAVLLVVNPLMFNLTTGQSLWLALLLSLLFSLPSLGDLIPNGRWWRLPALLTMLLALALGTWQARSFVPPAALRLTEVILSPSVDRERREAAGSITWIEAEHLHRDGLYAWTSVRVPRGLHERIHHVWLHEGRELDRIALDIRGGREQGYRAWSYKRHFPADPTGRWQVRIVTDSGQLIGLARFVVVPTVASTPPLPAE